MLRPTLKALLLIAAVSFLNFSIVGPIVGTIGHNVINVLISIWAGWYVCAKIGVGLFGAAGAGAFVFLIDHVVLKGGLFLVAHYFSPDVVQGNGPDVFVGVVLSFFMFVSVPAVFGVTGGFAHGCWAKRARGSD